MLIVDSYKVDCSFKINHNTITVKVISVLLNFGSIELYR